MIPSVYPFALGESGVPATLEGYCQATADAFLVFESVCGWFASSPMRPKETWKNWVFLQYDVPYVTVYDAEMGKLADK